MPSNEFTEVSPEHAAAYSFPVSFAQQRLWFLQQLEPEQTSYLVPIRLRLTGPLRVMNQ